MTTHEVLVAARNLISDEKNWCGDGEIGPTGGRCAITAVNAALREPYWSTRAIPATVALCEAVGVDYDAGEPGFDFGNWNDSHSHAEVLAAFDKAIAATAPEPDVSFIREAVEA